MRLVAAARRPLIWAGGGALRADAGDAVRALAHKLCAPVITTYMSRGLVSPDDPWVAAGPVHAPEVGALWDEADLVIGIGTDFDGVMTQNWLMPQPPRLICVNVDPADASKNYPADVTLVGDAREVTQQLAATVAARDHGEVMLARLEQVRAGVAAAVLADDADAAGFLAAMDRALPPEAVVVADMCIPGYWLAGYRRVPRPRAFAYPMGWGTLGFAFPASLGAALADAGPAVCVCGDGGFLFACGELATVAEAESRSRWSSSTTAATGCCALTRSWPATSLSASTSSSRTSPRWRARSGSGRAPWRASAPTSRPPCATA